ncbi:MAG: hypothetical protein V1897_03425, partial [Pseudomonadota bacterium]
EWLKSKWDLRHLLPAINAMTKEYHAYREEHPRVTHDEALLQTIRWRLNRAFFGSETTQPGSELYGELPDEEIIRMLKEHRSYEPVDKAAAFVAGIEMSFDKERKQGQDPLTWIIARQHHNRSGQPWRPKTIEEVEKMLWKEIETTGLISKGNETEPS